VVAVRSLEDARDRDLVRRVGAGDEGAFRALFRRYGALAKGVALRLVRQTFLAEEIVQEAFLALWRDPSSYREELGSFRAWLLAAVHHRAVDMVRREEAPRRRAGAPQRDAIDDIGQTVVEEVHLEETKARVREAMAGLPEAQRQIIELMYFQGKTQSAIAAELDLPLGTVKSRTLLAMRRMRTVLGEEA
jgi:RNA polymerase sigma factor (sigma-70 family)